ncbi:MAG TPA: ATP-dependent DNA helicase RecG [Candidatus Saccharimonadales bacterium]|nr:ATP-dependent DNA helicase RecG [Candidatus Saccharimonadales bacterium]
MKLSNPVDELKGVGSVLAKKYDVIGVNTVDDLINFYPRRYDDYSKVESIKQIKPGHVTIQAKIKQARGRYVRRGLHITEAVASDQSASVRLVWFNQPYRAKAIKLDANYYISGDFELSRQRLAIMNPSMELVSAFPVNTARIVPIYRETKGLRSFQVRKLIRQIAPIIKSLPETLPSWLITSQKLISRAEAIIAIHFPGDQQMLDEARRRLGFEEVFELTLAALLNKMELTGEHALNIKFDLNLAKDFIKHLPFQLTDNQRQVIWQIYQDIGRDQPMNRLVEGDVGSGKTVVATMAAVMAIKQDFQVAFMAPTELLARQHAETIQQLLKPLGLADRVGLLVGSLKPNQKTKIQQDIKAGRTQFIVGTHALTSQKVDIHRLGLIIIDEQHRFGVEQRKKLQAKAGHMPHILSLTATPIPRSLALTLYGELDISVISTKPAGRQPIITKLYSPNSRPQLYQTIKQELDSGRQVFVVCPIITESTSLAVESAEHLYQQLSTGPFKSYRLGLLHGKLKNDLKDKVMSQFSAGQIDMLVTTTVIEVGVDVPNASVMLIENAERFGLAQIHQLRGRVGRSHQQGYCYLMLGDSQSPSRRLKAIEQSNDGFKLAELDLEIRGPGAIYGTIQHGVLDLRVAKLTDVKLISAARSAAQMFIDKGENLVKYKHLSARILSLRAVTSLN